MNSNPSIKCSVSSCAYHNSQQCACTLNEIKVGCTTSNVADCTPPSARPSSWATTAPAASTESVKRIPAAIRPPGIFMGENSYHS